ncbi:MAG TPA: hypothetical protein VG271_13715 [Beijerinckiaceae bacterium]|nr:hypothetical protein [Beijerinckiaceae bacterium]
MNGIAFPPGRGSRLAPTNPSSGISCDETGPSLGPVHLLRRTPFGLEPRPQQELDFVFGKAFGAAVDWSKRMPDLAAVAEALDRNELALAKITTLHMRLPELDKTQVERARNADRLVKAGFNPGELRDARGWWTSDGSARISPGAGRAGRAVDRRFSGNANPSSDGHRAPAHGAGCGVAEKSTSSRESIPR